MGGLGCDCGRVGGKESGYLSGYLSGCPSVCLSAFALNHCDPPRAVGAEICLKNPLRGAPPRSLL